MKTKILKADQISEAVNLLKNGEVVALPTETVYGLAADAKNDLAISKIFIAKGRPTDHPLIVHINSLDEVYDWAEFVPEKAKELAKFFWPGSLTMIFMKKREVSDLITGGLNTVALRVPNHSIALEIIKKLGNAIVAPSANEYQKISPTDTGHVLKTLDSKIAAIVDGGSCSVGIESTILDMTKETPVILRSGAITAAMIENVINMKIECPLSHNEKISGNMEIHYQPEKPLFLFSLKEIEERLRVEKNIAVMHYSDMVKKSANAIYYRMSKNKAEYARDLYAMLHRIDNTSIKKIYVEIPPYLSEWSDVNDRLIKASSK